MTTPSAVRSAPAPRPVHRFSAVLLRGLAWGAATGGGAAATAVTPLVVWNGPPEALLVHPPLAGIAGATLGGVVGLTLAPAVAAAARRNRRR